MKKIIIANVLILIFVIFAIDIYSTFQDYKRINDCRKQVAEENGIKDFTSDKDTKMDFYYSLRLMPFKDYYRREMNRIGAKEARNVDKENEKKESIILFGCSYADGMLLEYLDKPSVLLAKLTKMPVYNRAFDGLGLGTMLWQVRSKKFWEDIKYPPKYVIHVYIPYHIGRLYSDKYGMSSFLPVYIGYNVKNNTLVENKIPYILFLRFKFIRKMIYEYNAHKYDTFENKDNTFDLIKLHYIETKKAITEKYPDVKFIIIKHPISKTIISDEYNDYMYNTTRWKELEDEGFIIYDLTKKLDVDITDKKYLLSDMHPNKKTWQLVIPKLIKDLNL